MQVSRRTYLESIGGLSIGILGGMAPASAMLTESHESSYGPLGEVALAGARDATVADGIAYVAAEDGFVTVDVTDPADPQILAERRNIDVGDGRTLDVIRDVWPWQDRLAVAGPAHPSSGPNGVALFDVSDPEHPSQVAFHETGAHVHNTFFADGMVYVTGRDDQTSLVMIDVTDDDPVEVGRWSPAEVHENWLAVAPALRSLHDVFVTDGTAYLPYWDAGTWIVDVSNPTDPTVLGHVGEYNLEALADVPQDQSHIVARTPRGADHYASVDDAQTVLAVGRETWAVDDSTGVVGSPGTRVGGASGVDLYDISDPTIPTHQARINPLLSVDQTINGWFTTAHNFEIVGERLYTAWYFGGLTIHDIADPSAPELLARWRNPREAAFWTAQRGPNCVVATSANIGSIYGGPNTARDALYTFPDRTGEQSDPPSLTEWPTDVLGPEPTSQPEPVWDAASVDVVIDSQDERGEDGDDGDDGEGGEDGQQESPTDTPDEGRNATDGDGNTPGPGGTDTNGTTADSDSDVLGPGFGVGVGLAGIGSYLLGQRAGELSNSPDE